MYMLHINGGVAIVIFDYCGVLVNVNVNVICEHFVGCHNRGGQEVPQS